MIKKLALTMTAWSMCIASGALAQSAEALFQSAINKKGKGCESITAMNPLGTTETGTPIIAVSCSGGETYALQINADKSVSYISTCAALESVSGVSCF